MRGSRPLPRQGANEGPRRSIRGCRWALRAGATCALVPAASTLRLIFSPTIDCLADGLADVRQDFRRHRTVPHGNGHEAQAVGQFRKKP